MKIKWFKISGKLSGIIVVISGFSILINTIHVDDFNFFMYISAILASASSIAYGISMINDKWEYK